MARFLFLILFVLVGCGKNITPRNQEINPQYINDSRFTGLTKVTPAGDVIAYTDTKRTPTLQNLKTEIQSTWDEKGIKEQSQQLLSQMSEQKVKIVGAQIEISIKINKQVFVFKSEFDLTGDRRSFFERRNERPAKDFYYTVKGSCASDECNEIPIYLSKFDSQNKLLAQVAFVYRKIQATGTAQLPKGQAAPSNKQLKKLYERFQTPRSITVEDYVVAGGTSTSTVGLTPKGKRLCLKIENLETGTMSNAVRDECDPVSEIQVSLVGNTGVGSDTEDPEGSEAADQILAFEDPKKHERVYVEVKRSTVEEKPETLQEVTDEELRANLQPYFIPAKASNARVLHITKEFERYRKWSGLPKVIKDFDRDTKIQNYLNNIKDPLRYLKPIFDRNNLPATFFYMTSWETGYFTGDKQTNLRNIVGGSCEVGIWQFTYSTAGDFRQFMPNVIDIPGRRKSKVPCPRRKGHSYTVNVNDDRLYYVPATQAAAKYLSNLVDSNPDPVLAVMSFNRGLETVNKTLGKYKLNNSRGYQLALDLGFDLVQLAKYDVPGVSYVKKFIAMYFIGSNPEAHGYSRHQVGLKATCEELYPPRLRAQFCK